MHLVDAVSPGVNLQAILQVQQHEHTPDVANESTTMISGSELRW